MLYGSLRSSAFPICWHIDAFLGLLLPRVDQWNHVNPMSRMCTVSLVCLCECTKKPMNPYVCVRANRPTSYRQQSTVRSDAIHIGDLYLHQKSKNQVQILQMSSSSSHTQTNRARKQPRNQVRESRWFSWKKKRSCTPASIIHRLGYLLLLQC